MNFKEFINNTIFLYESSLDKAIEKDIKSKIEKLNKEESIAKLKKLHDKVIAKQSSAEEGAEYHFLKMHIKALIKDEVKKQGKKTVINDISKFMDFKPVSVRVLSDYGHMKNLEDYTKKPMPLKLLHSISNAKLGKDTMIFNMGSATDCASRKKGMCQVCVGGGKCYALKAEIQYSGDTSSAIRKRRLQGEQWKSFSIDNLAKQFKDIANAHSEVYFLRINESGDFNNQEDIDKASMLADKLKGVVTVYMYTARKDLDFSDLSSNLVINGSGFMIDNEFRFIPKKHIKDIKPTDTVCSGDCPNCTYCKEKKKRVIKIKEH
jgi:hypothetical protein